MEEKKVTKISLSTFFLLLAIIVIMVMGIYIYKLQNDKTTELKKSTELQSQVGKLNETASELQSEINNISNTINSNSSTNSETNSAINKQNDSTNIDNECKRKVEDCLNLFLDLNGDPASIVSKIDSNAKINNNINDTFLKTSIEYKKFESYLLQYATQECLNKYVMNQYKNSDGYLAVRNGAGTGINITITRFNKIANLKYNVDFCDPNEKITFSRIITLKQLNGTFVVDTIENNKNTELFNDIF